MKKFNANHFEKFRMNLRIVLICVGSFLIVLSVLLKTKKLHADSCDDYYCFGLPFPIEIHFPNKDEIVWHAEEYAREYDRTHDCESKESNQESHSEPEQSRDRENS